MKKLRVTFSLNDAFVVDVIGRNENECWSIINEASRSYGFKIKIVNVDEVADSWGTGIFQSTYSESNIVFGGLYVSDEPEAVSDNNFQSQSQKQADGKQ